MRAHVAGLLIMTSVSALATPLLVAPAVLLGVFASLYMMYEGWVGQLKFGDCHAKIAVWHLSIAFGGWFIVTMFSALIHRDSLSEIDTAVRFLLAIGGFWLVRAAADKRLHLAIYGIVAGSIGAGVIAVYQYATLDIERVSGWTNNTIYFGNLSILLCIYVAILLLSYKNNLTIAMRTILFTCLLLTVFASLASMSRSSFLALLGLIVLVRVEHVTVKRIMLLVSLCIAALFLIQQTIGHHRYVETVNEIRSIKQGDYSGSLGQRIQMWEGSIRLFQTSPIIGVGAGNYRQSIEQLVEHGSVSITERGRSHEQPHSSLFDALACKGILGLLAYLLLFILPYRMIGKITKNGNEEILLLCKLCKATIIAFFIFGLTNSIFRIQVYAVVYPMTLAVFTAMILNLRSNDSRLEAQ